MQYQVFKIPACASPGQVEEMNRFLRGHRVLTVERRFVEDGQNSFWTFCVEFLETSAAVGMPTESRVDYKRGAEPWGV